MITLGLFILIVSGFIALYMSGIIPPFLGSIPVSYATGQWSIVVSAGGVIVGLVLTMIGVAIK